MEPRVFHVPAEGVGQWSPAFGGGETVLVVDLDETLEVGMTVEIQLAYPTSFHSRQEEKHWSLSN